jgi:hypothetical protein
VAGEGQELVVITKAYDLVLWSCHHTSRRPRNHRFVLGERIERKLYDLLTTLVKARYTRERQGLLGQRDKIDLSRPTFATSGRRTPATCLRGE